MGWANERVWANLFVRAAPARDVETRDVSAGVKEKESGGDSLFRSLFWVLRRDEEMEVEQEEVERRVDVVEDSLEGCREGLEGSWCAMVWRGEAWVRNLFSRFGGVKFEDRLLPHEACC